MESSGTISKRKRTKSATEVIDIDFETIDLESEEKSPPVVDSVQIGQFDNKTEEEYKKIISDLSERVRVMQIMNLNRYKARGLFIDDRKEKNKMLREQQIRIEELESEKLDIKHEARMAERAIWEREKRSWQKKEKKLYKRVTILSRNLKFAKDEIQLVKIAESCLESECKEKKNLIVEIRNENDCLRKEIRSLEEKEINVEKSPTISEIEIMLRFDEMNDELVSHLSDKSALVE